jgi:hypothetical protein
MTLERFPAGSCGKRRTAFFPRVSDETQAGVALRRFRRRGEQNREPPLILVYVERTLIQPVAGRRSRVQLLLIEQRPGAGRWGQRSEERGPFQQSSSLHVFRSET